MEDQVTEQHISVREFAARLSLNQDTVRRWIHDSKLHAIHVGDAVRLPVSELARLVREGTKVRK